MQPANDEDFQIEAKFESQPSLKYQGQGMLVQADESNYMRFDFHSTGTSFRVFAASITNSSPSIRINKKITPSPTTYLRVERAGDLWTVEYSYDGSSWTTAGSFSHSLAVSSVGVFVSNFNPNPASLSGVA